MLALLVNATFLTARLDWEFVWLDPFVKGLGLTLLLIPEFEESGVDLS
jgi:hypothetical protein